MARDVRQPRASIACSRNRDPQYLALASSIDGLAAVAVFDALLCAAKDQDNEGVFTCPYSVIAMLCGVQESIFIQSVIKLVSLNWLIEIKGESLIIRNFTKWNPRGSGGPRPGAGRPPATKDSKGIKPKSNTIQNNLPPSPSPSPITTTTLAISSPTDEVPKAKKVFVYPEDFEVFWTHYPNKAGKGAAFAAWKRLDADSKAKATDQAEWWAGCWKHHDPHGDRAKFIPHASTFLNQRRFDDADEAVELMARGR